MDGKVGEGSGGLRQPQKFGGDLAPEGIYQSGLEQAGAVAVIAGGYRIAAPRCREGRAVQPAGFGDDTAGLGIGRDRLLPEDDPGPDLSGESQALVTVLNDHDARTETQRIVRADADFPVRDALAGEDHGIYGGWALADDDRAVETVGITETIVTGGANAGDAQGQSLGVVQPGQHLTRDDFTDGSERSLAG